MKPIISLTNVTKTYNDNREAVHIYKDLNREVAQGDYVAIMGRSGSGKTTLLNMIAGIETKYEGDLQAMHHNLNTYNDEQLTEYRSKHISFVFQDFLLLPQLTVEENIDLVIEMNNRERIFDTKEIIEMVGLSGKEKRYANILSGGEQQRVALARAFVAKTDILLADEPTGNLDEDNAHKTMKLMADLHKKTGSTIVMITHDKMIADYANKTYSVKDMGLAQL